MSVFIVVLFTSSERVLRNMLECSSTLKYGCYIVNRISQLGSSNTQVLYRASVVLFVYFSRKVSTYVWYCVRKTGARKEYINLNVYYKKTVCNKRLH